MRYPIVFFDLDGTIMKTDEGVTNAYAYAAEKLGRTDIPIGDTELYMGPSIDSVCKKIGYDEELTREFVLAMREYYVAKGINQCRPYEGVIELMHELKDKGCDVYICTAKPVASARKIEAKFGFGDIVLAGSEGVNIDKPEILRAFLQKLGVDPSQCAMIGDRYTDLLGGRQNNTHTVGVLYGYGPREELESCAPDYIAQTVAQLREWLLGE